MTRLLNRLQFLNLKMIRLLKGSIVLTHLSNFMKEKKNTIFCINPVDPDYKKKKKQIGRWGEIEVWECEAAMGRGRKQLGKKISLYA